MDSPKDSSLEIPRRVFADTSSRKTSAESSAATSRSSSVHEDEMNQTKEKHQVRFDSTTKPPSSRPINDARRENSLSGRLQETKPLPRSIRSSSSTPPDIRSSNLPTQALTRSSTDITESRGRSPISKRRQGLFILGEDEDIELEDLTEVEEDSDADARAQQWKDRSQQKANSQAQNLQREMEDKDYELYNPSSESAMSSPAVTRSSSLHRSMDMPFDPIDLDERLEHAPKRYSGIDKTNDRSEGQQNGPNSAGNLLSHVRGIVGPIVRALGPKTDEESLHRVKALGSGLQAGQWTPTDDEGDPDWYVAPPKEYRKGVVASLMKLYHDEGLHGFASRNNLSSITPNISPHTSGASTPIALKSPHWYKAVSSSQSNSSLSNLINASTILGQPGSPAIADTRPQIKREPSSGRLGRYMGAHKRSRSEQIVHIRDHIEEQGYRCKYIVELCKALMAYGAPTHRLEGVWSSLHVFIPSIIPSFQSSPSQHVYLECTIQCSFSAF